MGGKKASPVPFVPSGVGEECTFVNIRVLIVTDEFSRNRPNRFNLHAQRGRCCARGARPPACTRRHSDVRWDVLVVDNNSTDGTAGVVRQYRETWDRSAAPRIVTEQQQGLAFARQRAVDEARGKLVAFLDDDNLPAPDWVAEVVSFAEEHPNAGAFGGQLIGEYEVEPPRSFGLVKRLFAINTSILDVSPERTPLKVELCLRIRLGCPERRLTMMIRFPMS